MRRPARWKHPDDCPRCFGTGYVFAWAERLEDDQSDGTKDCPVCGGSGDRQDTVIDAAHD